MLVIKTSSELIKLIDTIKKRKELIAFVPTMGNLHQGHLNLVKLAHQNASIVIVSIFVNPLQFNQPEDLNNYPRTLEQDIKLCEQNDVDMIFAPSISDFYPNGDEEERIEIVELLQLTNILEGASRPGHFSGVVTVVKKFFDLVRPDYAIFGEKDFQQLLVIKKMVELLDLPVKIISSETIRETNGLAMSSRNSKLNEQERQHAAQIYLILNSIREQIMSGNKDFIELSNTAVLSLTNVGFNVDYLVIRNSDDLQPMSANDNSNGVILIAAWLGEIRLIDNFRI